jgi:transcriptional regulator with XRE-family HTH domain
MMRTFEDDLKKELQDPESARIFGGAHANSSFALTLALARQKLGVTQQELAERAGVSQAYIAKLEGGEANPTLGRIGSLLAVLGLSLTTDVAPLSPYSEKQKSCSTAESFRYAEMSASPLARENKARYEKGGGKLKGQKSKP